MVSQSINSICAMGSDRPLYSSIPKLAEMNIGFFFDNYPDPRTNTNPR